MRQINEIILHCSAGAVTDTAEEIRRYHVKVNGWQDIGYHWVIRQDGKIDQGRLEHKVGAHCKGHNANSIGICLVGGGGTPPRENFKAAQFASLAILLRDVCASFPEATIHGHNEYANKACPVFSVRKFAERYAPELVGRLGAKTK